jgi:integrase
VQLVGSNPPILRPRQVRAPTKKLYHFDELAVARGLPRMYLGCPFLPRGDAGGKLLNRYLRARWKNDWNPKMGRQTDGKPGGNVPVDDDPFAVSMGKRICGASLDQTARNVDNFLDWWEATVLEDEDWPSRLSGIREMVIQDYGDAMGCGAWSADGNDLSASTIRSRQTDAIQFFRYAKHRGLAPAFVLSTASHAIKVASYSGAVSVKHRVSYTVVRRADPRRITFPTTEEVRQHVMGIGDAAHQAGAVLVYGCGLRATEAINFAEADIEEPKRAGDQYFLRIKGKGGVTRRVEVSAGIVKYLRRFAEFERSIRLAGVPLAERPPQLLVREDGTPLTYRSFWRAFRRNSKISPHLGRHWYSVNFLICAHQAAREAAQRDGREFRYHDPVFELQIDLIRLQQNLGHESLTTTYRYLVALSQQLQPIDISVAFQELIDG